MRMREHWQSPHKPGEEDEDTGCEVESPIESHRREAIGPWYVAA